MKIKYVKKHPKAVVPMKATTHAAGHDVTVTEVIHKGPGKVYCKLGLAMQPEDTSRKIILVPRSSLTKTNWVMNNSPGIGDPDYTHEYQMRFTAIPTGVKVKFQWKRPFVKLELTYDKFPYVAGDRIGQMFISKIHLLEWEEVDHIDNSKSNRDGGFGHTGK